MIRSLSRVLGASLRITRSSALEAVSFFNHPRQLSTTSVAYRHPGITYPYHVSFRWAVERVINPDEYTVEALPLVRTGGRGPDGRIQYKHRTKGLNRPWFMVDYNYSRHLPTGEPRDELVLKVVRNWWRSPFLALVASGEVKRWIVATSTMKPGDVIRSHVGIPLVPVIPKAGDAYPVGALPVGTSICLIELRPGQGAIKCRAAGTSASIVRRGKFVGDPEAPPALSTEDLLSDERAVIVRDNGTRNLLRLLPECMAVVGQVSNTIRKAERFSKFGEKKWRGIKQRSGLWQRKTGRFGRKIHPTGQLEDFVAEGSSTNQFTLKCTLPHEAEYNRRKVRALHALVHNRKVGNKHQPTPGEFNALPDKQPRFCWSSWTSVR